MTNLAPYLAVTARDLEGVLGLIHREFAFMDGRIDPPSSRHLLTVPRLFASGEVWAIGPPPVACMVLTPKDEALYIGKLAVASDQRGKGLARRMMDFAAVRAGALGLRSLDLQTRVELVENQKVFRALGFTEVGRSCHPGYPEPTTILFRRPV